MIPEREGLPGTPARVVRAYEEWFAGYFEDPREYLQRTFEEVAGYDEIVLLRDIRFEVALRASHGADHRPRPHRLPSPQSRCWNFKSSRVWSMSMQSVCRCRKDDRRNRATVSTASRSRMGWCGGRGGARMHDDHRGVHKPGRHHADQLPVGICSGQCRKRARNFCPPSI